MSVISGDKVTVINGINTGMIAHCTWSDGVFVRITPVNGNPLDSIQINIEDVRELTADDCQCADTLSYALNQCNECPR